MTTADYLNQLEQDREDLVDNLEAQGITGLTGDETFTELVPEVLNISGGGGSEYTGHYDATGLAQLNWTAEDIAYYQDNAVYWNSDKDDDYNVRSDELNGNAGNKTRFPNKNSFVSVYFFNYQSLLGVPVFNTTNQTNWNGAFQNCRSLIYVPPLMTQSATDTGNMFSGCWNLKNISLFDTSNVTTMNNMFNTCYALEKIPLLNTSSVSSMNYMFNNCYNLRTIPLLNTSNVTTMNGMFYYCYNLREIPAIDTGNVTNFAEMFNSCNALVSVPVLDTKNATSLSSMFSSCNSLSDNSLNNILQMCIDAVKITNFKTLNNLGISSSRYGARIQTLSNYQAFLNAGWTIS